MNKPTPCTGNKGYTVCREWAAIVKPTTSWSAFIITTCWQFLIWVTKYNSPLDTLPWIPCPRYPIVPSPTFCSEMLSLPHFMSTPAAQFWRLKKFHLSYYFTVLTSDFTVLTSSSGNASKISISSTIPCITAHTYHKSHPQVKTTLTLSTRHKSCPYAIVKHIPSEAGIPFFHGI